MNKNQLYNLIAKRRSIRLYKQKEIPLAVIKKAINAARLAPSAANLQFLEYLVVKNKILRDKIFLHTRWAGYLYPRRTPPKDKQPTLYILVLIHKNKSKNFDSRDVGAAVENMMLTFLSEGLGTCWIASLEKQALRKFLRIPNYYEIDSLVAAGIAAEKPRLETKEKNVEYWLDSKNKLHVPKRPLEKIFHLDRIK